MRKERNQTTCEVAPTVEPVAHTPESLRTLQTRRGLKRNTWMELNRDIVKLLKENADRENVVEEHRALQVKRAAAER